MTEPKGWRRDLDGDYPSEPKLPDGFRHDWTTPPLSKANPVRAWACRVTLFVGVVVAGFAAVDRWMG